MGHNLDFEWMLGLPKTTKCPNCTFNTPTYFFEYDIDCGFDGVKEGITTFWMNCEKCDEEFEFRIKVEVIK